MSKKGVSRSRRTPGPDSSNIAHPCNVGASRFITRIKSSYNELGGKKPAAKEFRMFEALYPRVITTAKQCLKDLAKKAATVSYTIYPREYFVQLQVSLTASGLLRKIHKRYLAIDDLHQDVGNLFFLWDLLKHDRASCVGLLKFSRQLVKAVSQLSKVLELVSDALDWTAVGDALTIEGKQETLRSVIPKLKDIQPIKTLGAGGFGSVYKVLIGGTELTGKLVSIEKFSNARSASSDKLVVSMAQGPFLATYHSCFCADKAFVTVMEYIRGADLSRMIKVTGRIAEDIVAVIIAQLCLAVFYLHIQGIMHRDIKPSNIMILPNGRIKLLDYDTCKVCVGLYGDGITGSWTRKTFMEFHDGESAGTPAFLAPEIIAKARYGRASDWWSVGTTAYQLACGSLPFRGNKIEVVKKKIRRAVFVPPQRSSDSFRRLAKGFLRKTVGQRLTSARFKEIVDHNFFSSVNWETLENSKNPCDVEHLVSGLMEPSSNGGYSPPEKIIDLKDRKRKQRKLMSFEEVSDGHQQIELYTYWSEWLQSSIDRLDRPEEITPPGTDTDYIRRPDNIYLKRSSQRLKEFRR